MTLQNYIYIGMHIVPTFSLFTHSEKKNVVLNTSDQYYSYVNYIDGLSLKYNQH